MSFRKAYQTTSSIVNFAEKKRKRLDELSIEEIRIFEPKLTAEVLSIFSAENSVNSKKSYGGTSFENIKKMIMKYKKSIK
jgi:argininosuccinate lyase